MKRWLLKRQIKRDLVENVLYTNIELFDEHGVGSVYHINGFDDKYLKFIDLTYFSQFMMKWEDINTDWRYIGVSHKLWNHFETLASERDMERSMVYMAVKAMEGSRYRIPAYTTPDGKVFYITQSHNFQRDQDHWSVTLYRGMEDQSAGMRAVTYASHKGRLEWNLGPREQCPDWGHGAKYNDPHHWLTVDATEAKEGVLPWGDVLYQTQRDGILQYHVGRTTIHPGLLPEATGQPMAINDGSIRSILASQLRHHYIDELTVLDYTLDQPSVYRAHYPKYVQDFMGGLLPGQRLVLAPGIALVSGPYERMAVLQHANRSYSHLGLMHVQDGTGRKHAFGHDSLRQLMQDLNTMLHACGVKAEHRFINFEVEGQ